MTKRRNNPSDPTAERTADQASVTAIEGTGAPGIRPQDDDDDLIARNAENARATPRRYEHAAADDE